jgi:regulator of cell morphogenesis and NO signaling
MTQPVEKTVGEIAAENPSAAKVFEKHHIDYSCGGKHPLADACRVAGASAEEVLQEVSEASLQKTDGEPDWNTAPLRDLIRHIVEKHHGWLYSKLALIDHLIVQAAHLHTESPTSIHALQKVFNKLRTECSTHMEEEERVLFPAIVQLESRTGSEPALGAVRDPISMLEHDHDVAAGYLDELRDLTYGYALEDDASHSFRTLYDELQALEADMHQHLHLENNILFPRAARLEMEAHL